MAAPAARAHPEASPPPRPSDPSDPWDPSGRRGRVARVTGLPLAALAGVVARVRRARALHPVGTTSQALLHLDQPLGRLAVGAHPALVRLSRGGGLPTWCPDVSGIAVRALPGAHGGVQDVLMSSSARAPLVRRVPRPTWRPRRAWHSGLVPFRIGSERVLFGARWAADGSRIELFRCRARGRGRGWTSLGWVEVGAELDEHEDASLGFDPWHDGAGLEPVGVLNAWRAAAYASSRRGRGHPSAAAGDGAPPRADR